MKRLRWEKRLKWFRISRMVIPIALAISLIFVGFTVYADEAQNFIIRVENDEEIRLGLTLDQNALTPEGYSLNKFTSVLSVPFTESQTASTFDPEELGYSNYYYSQNDTNLNIPNNIARLGGGLHFGTTMQQGSRQATYSAVSFWLVNLSDRPVDVDIVMNFDGLLTYNNALNHHIDDVLRIMVIEDEPLITDNTYSIYSKAEDPNHPYHEDAHAGPVNYTTTNFLSDRCVFSREGEAGLQNFATFQAGSGQAKKFTIVIWLEGNDEQCSNDIFGERARLSIDFIGH